MRKVLAIVCGDYTRVGVMSIEIITSLGRAIEEILKLSEISYDDARLVVDVINSIVLKKKHVVFGRLMKRIAELVKSVNPPKGHWQPYWVAAMKTLECWKSDKPLNACIEYARSAVRPFANVDYTKVDQIVRLVYSQAQDILSETGAWIKRYYGVSAAGARAAGARR